MLRVWPLLLPALFLGIATGQQLKKQVEVSSCHAFIDYENIWTIEIMRTQSTEAVPILNVITFTPGEWDLRPEQIHVFDKEGSSEAEVTRFSIDTGVAADPYNTKYLKVLGNSFIGFDLLGKFEGFEESPRVAIDLGHLKVLGNSFIGFDLLGKFEGFEESPRVAIDLGHTRFELKPLDCVSFERLAAQINNINFNSPDIQEDFSILKIEHLGRKIPRPKAGYW